MALNPLNAASAAHSLKPLGLGLVAAGSTAAISFIASAALNHMVKPEQLASKWAVEVVSVAIGAAAAVAVGASSVAAFVGCAVYGIVALSQMPISSEQIDWERAKGLVEGQISENQRDNGSGAAISRLAHREGVLYCETESEDKKFSFRKQFERPGQTASEASTSYSKAFCIVEGEETMRFSSEKQPVVSFENLEFYEEKYAWGKVEIRVAFKKEAPDPRSFLSDMELNAAIGRPTSTLPYRIASHDVCDFLDYEVGEAQPQVEALKTNHPVAFGDLKFDEITGEVHLTQTSSKMNAGDYFLIVHNHPRFGACVFTVPPKETGATAELRVFPLLWSDRAVQLDMDKELVHLRQGKFALKSESQPIHTEAAFVGDFKFELSNMIEIP